MEIHRDNIDIQSDDFLWKYMDIHKFLYFLNENKIYFTRLDLFDDPLEGLSDRVIGDKFIFENRPPRNELNPNICEEDRMRIADQTEKGLKDIEEVREIVQKKRFASCWFKSSRESLAMWNLYSNKESIAIRFKADNLISLIEDSAKKVNKHSMTIGSVDYRKIYPPEFDADKKEVIKNRYSAHKKDISYEHEREFRFVIYTNQINDTEIGLNLKVPDLKKLDFYIVAHPYMPNWQYDNLQKLLKDKFQIETKLQKSQISIKTTKQ